MKGEAADWHVLLRRQSSFEPGTRVVVTFTPEDGGTRVVLQHHDLPDDAQRSHHGQGWEMYLDRLGVRVSGGDPGPDPNAA